MRNRAQRIGREHVSKMAGAAPWNAGYGEFFDPQILTAPPFTRHARSDLKRSHCLRPPRTPSYFRAFSLRPLLRRTAGTAAVLVDLRNSTPGGLQSSLYFLTRFTTPAKGAIGRFEALYCRQRSAGTPS